MDCDILFHRVNLFGRENNTYSVSLTLATGLGFPWKLCTSTEGTFCSLSNSSGEFYGFDVLFTEPIPLAKGEEYNLTAQVTGPESWYGTEGHSTSSCSAVSFTIKDTAFLSGDVKRTCPEQGQFNEFIFSIIKF